MMVTFEVVRCYVVGNPEHGYEIARSWCASLPTLAAAKRWGLRELGHDDFNIAVVDGGVLKRWTWMGEDIGEEPESFAEIARSLDWKAAS